MIMVYEILFANTQNSLCTFDMNLACNRILVGKIHFSRALSWIFSTFETSSTYFRPSLCSGRKICQNVSNVEKNLDKALEKWIFPPKLILVLKIKADFTHDKKVNLGASLYRNRKLFQHPGNNIFKFFHVFLLYLVDPRPRNCPVLFPASSGDCESIKLI